MANDPEDRRTQWEAMGYKHDREPLPEPPKVDGVKYETSGEGHGVLPPDVIRRDHYRNVLDDALKSGHKVLDASMDPLPKWQQFWLGLLVGSVITAVGSAYVGIWGSDISLGPKIFLTALMTGIIAGIGASVTEVKKLDKETK